MHPSTKLALAAPVHTLLLYRRPLHPELFHVKSRKTMAIRGGIEAEAWLLPLGHMVRVQSGGHCLCELVIDRDNGLPTQGVIKVYPTAGDNDYELLLEDAALMHNSSTQTESLSPRLYASTLIEQQALAAETHALVHTWKLPEHAPTPEGTCLSLLDLATYDGELHVSSTHMHPAGGLVLRTQSVIHRV